MTELEMEMARKMRSRTEKLGHDGECWSDEEKDRLKFLFDNGYGITEIALMLERSEPAVFQQVEKMDLFGRQMNPVRRKKLRCKCRCGSCPLREVCSKWEE